MKIFDFPEWASLFLIVVIIIFLFTYRGLSQVAFDDEPTPTVSNLKMETALSIARLYRLSREQAILMLAIRDHENGEKAKKEFGIEGLPPVNNSLERYCRNAARCAWLIKNFCSDTTIKKIEKFNHGFGKCKDRYRGYSEDKLWWLKVMRCMKKYRTILY